MGGREERAGDKDTASSGACRWSQRLLAGNSTSEKHIVPMEEVNWAAVYGPWPASHNITKVNKDQAKIFVSLVSQNF